MLATAIVLIRLLPAGHHRSLLPERPVNARALNFLGLGLVGIVGVTFLILTPRFAELDTVLELTIYMIMAILALSLALIWGYGGILCFGQSAFFGLGAYTYAIAMFSIGESTVPLLSGDRSTGGVCRVVSAILCSMDASATCISASLR